MDANTPDGLLRWFGDLEDPRPGHNVMHRLSDMLAIAILAVLCGADSWVDVATFGRCRLAWLRTFLSLPHGIPSHDTFGRVFGRLDPVQFEKRFMNWMAAVAQSDVRWIALDGKTLRHSFDHASEKAAIHMISAFSQANPLCPNEVPKQPCLPVERSSHGRPVLCATCRRACDWGATLAAMATVPKKLWVAAVTHRGNVVHAEAVVGKVKAVKALAEYLKTEEGYVGPAQLPGICAWLGEHDERLGIELFRASMDAAGEDSCSWDASDNPKAQRGLVIAPPPQEEGPELLYRAVYAIDVNAQDAHQAAERAYQIMIDPESMRPVLYLLDGEGSQTIVDLAAESSHAPDGSEASELRAKTRRFVQANGMRCPQCNSNEIEFGAVELDARCAYQESCCRRCQVRFCAVYRLAGYGLHVGGSFEVHTLSGDHTAAGDDDRQTES